MKKLLSSLVAFALVVSFSITGISAEPKLPSLPGMEPEPVIVEGEISITTGWNLIAMPVLPVGQYTVKQFIKAVERMEYREEIIPVYEEKGELLPYLEWDVLTVAVYKDGQFKNLPPKEYSYNMVPGEAYFVYATYIGGKIFKRPPRKTVKVKGRIPDVPVTPNLDRGWNGVSLFPGMGLFSINKEANIVKIGSLGQLSEDLVAQGIKATKIAFWSATDQNWDVHALPYDGQNGNSYTDRLIMASEGFFLLLPDENGLYIPGLEIEKQLKIKETLIATSEGAHVLRCPAIYGDNIAWINDYSAGNQDVFIYDLAKGQETQITDDYHRQYSVAIYGDKIIWEDGRNRNNDIYMRDIITGEETRISDSKGGGALRPAIYKDKIVWETNTYGYYYMIMHDLSTGQTAQIPEDSDPKAHRYSNLDIYGDKVVYADYQNGQRNIYMYTVSTDEEMQITKDAGHKEHPVIYGDKIVWTDTRNGNSDIYMYDLSTGEETQITSDPAEQFDPAIHEDKIIWLDTRNGTSIYMYDISTGRAIRLGLKATPIHTGQLDIYGNRIVWVDVWNDIYMAELSWK